MNKKMTKEDIQRNSEHWYNLYKQSQSQLTEKDKTIKDLEWQIKEIVEDNDYYRKDNVEKDEQIEKLETQNVKLIGELGFTTNDLNNCKAKIDELEAQIEKMKRCCNCLYEDYDSWKGKNCNGCHKYSHWKLKE